MRESLVWVMDHLGDDDAVLETSNSISRKRRTGSVRFPSVWHSTTFIRAATYFGHRIVVGTEIQTSQAVEIIGKRRHYDNARGTSLRKTGQHADAVQFRGADIQTHEFCFSSAQYCRAVPTSVA